MSEPACKLDDIEWVGGHPALDFVNTVHAWTDGRAGEEYLHGFEDVLRWNRMAGLIGPRDAQWLRRGSARSRAAAHRAALDLRASLYSLFHALAADAPVPGPALDHLNAVLRKTAEWRRLKASDSGIETGWDFSGAPAAAVLGPVAWQAVELLEYGPPDRIKECPWEEGCGWLFLDTSKNRSRVWCSMKTCGNAAKARAYYRRRRRAN